GRRTDRGSPAALTPPDVEQQRLWVLAAHVPFLRCGERRGGVAAMRGRHLVAALARRVGAFLDVTPASPAPGRPPLGQGEHPGHVPLATLRRPSGAGADEAPLLVVLVYGLLGRLPAVEAARADPEPLGRLYAGSEARIREAAGEKGMLTSRRF